MTTIDHPLLAELWAARHRQPARMLPLAQQLLAEAGDDRRLQAHAWLHCGWGCTWTGHTAERDDALRRALGLFEALHDEAGLANCRDLQAVVCNAAKRFDDGLALLQANAALPDTQRHGYERYVTQRAMYAAYCALDRNDDALRTLYRLSDAARDSGDEAAMATALALLGSQQSDLWNLEAAEQLCTEGAALAERAGARQAWMVASLSLLEVHVNRGNAVAALPLAERLVGMVDEMRPTNREEDWILLAEAFLHAGEVARAQRMLDESVGMRHSGRQRVLDWTAAQAEAWVAQGRWAEARALCEGFLAAPPDSTGGSARPGEMIRIRRALAQACEREGDLQAALTHEREASRWQEAQVGRTARARRLSLEIEHDLDRERWKAEAAQRREQDAEAERLRLDALNGALREANDAKTRFLAAASHDLRQPVQALTMYMSALQRERSAALRSSLMKRMDQSLHALSGMFDVLLDISRLDAGLVTPQRTALALDELLARLVDEHALRARERGLSLRLHRPRGLPRAATESDPVLLEACLRNLVDNALKYTVRGGVVLRLRLAPGNSDTWRIEVRDSGPGIDAALQARVFEEFFQVGNEERDRSKGLGLGLSIVRRTLALLEHPISLRSRPGHGACFAVELPRTEPAIPAHGADAGERTGVDGRAMGLIVVDDDFQVRDSLAALLGRWGHQVIHAADAGEALAAWRQQQRPPMHAALVDLRLRGGRTGLDAIAELRGQFGAALPALVMTGDMAPDRLRLLAEAGQPWLPKPLMPMRLRSWLQGLAP